MRILELRLFYHYTSVTSLTIPRYGQVELDQLWEKDVPQLCFSFDVVLSAVLGHTATHYLSLDPGNLEMKLAAQRYLDQTIKQHSELVSNLTKENAEPVVLVAMFVVLQMRLRIALVNQDEPYRLPLEYFHMHHGTTALYHECIPFLRNSNVLVALGIEPAKIVIGARAGDFLPRLIWNDSLSLLKGPDFEDIDLKVRSVYERCLAYLDILYVALLKEEDPQWTRRRLYAMPTYVGTEFVDLLEQQDPRAMAILARFVALTKLCDGVRYFPGSAEFEVQGIMSLMPPDWLWAMDWPNQILRLNKLADCEVQNVAPEPEFMGYPSVEELGFGLANDLYLDIPLGPSDHSSDTTVPPSGSHQPSTLFSGPYGSNIGSRLSPQVRRCWEMRYVEEEKVILEPDEIFARHDASVHGSLGEGSRF